MIRRAVEADIPWMAAMGEDFHGLSPHKDMGDYDRAAVARMLRFMIGAENCIVLTNGEGVIGGMLAPVYFNPSKTMLEESFWYARKGGRELLRAFCKEGRLSGADYVLLSTLENDMAEAADRIVKKSGFAQIERRYLKELA